MNGTLRNDIDDEKRDDVSVWGNTAPASSVAIPSEEQVLGGMDASQITDGVEECVLRFFAIGDFGMRIDDQWNPQLQLGEAMNIYATEHGIPDLVLGLGDNFYFYNGTEGVDSVTDVKWQHWIESYLVHASLRCPWKVVLGNHDYDGNPYAEIEFTKHTSNPLLENRSSSLFGVREEEITAEVACERTWQMPAANYTFTEANGLVEFFALDTNGVQKSVVRQYPNTKDELRANISQLSSSLQTSDAHWKIVFGHHPMHTQGRYHGALGKLLRTDVAVAGSQRGTSSSGYGLEKVLSRGQADAYITGHEHAFQHHFSQGVHSFVCGASVEYAFYQGRNKEQIIDWVDESESIGFLAVEVFRCKLVLRFIIYGHNNVVTQPTTCSILKEVVIRKDL